MFEDIRKSYGLTRNELAFITGRGVNYILKAEQGCFPSAPAALLNFYANPQPPKIQLKQVWEPRDRDELISAYRDYQRRKRREWLDDYKPNAEPTRHLPFRKKWHAAEWAYGASAVGSFETIGGVYPTQYGLSVGLCLPAAVVYRNDKELTPAGAIRDAMGDLVEYANSGELTAAKYGDEGLDFLIVGVLRIASEEGVKLHDHEPTT